MRITDAEAAIREAAADLAELPRELATSIHGMTAGKPAAEVERRLNPDNSVTHASDVWAEMRATAADLTDFADLDKPIAALHDAIVGIRAAIHD